MTTIVDSVDLKQELNRSLAIQGTPATPKQPSSGQQMVPPALSRSQARQGGHSSRADPAQAQAKVQQLLAGNIGMMEEDAEEEEDPGAEERRPSCRNPSYIPLPP